MKNPKRKQVVLEPELEAIAGELSPFDRLCLARKLARWVRQLEISSRVLQGRRGPRQQRGPVRQRVRWN